MVHLVPKADVVKVHPQGLLILLVEMGKEPFHQTVYEQNWWRRRERGERGEGEGEVSRVAQC